MHAAQLLKSIHILSTLMQLALALVCPATILWFAIESIAGGPVIPAYVALVGSSYISIITLFTMLGVAFNVRATVDDVVRRSRGTHRDSILWVGVVDAAVGLVDLVLAIWLNVAWLEWGRGDEVFAPFVIATMAGIVAIFAAAMSTSVWIEVAAAQEIGRECGGVVLVDERTRLVEESPHGGQQVQGALD